MRPLEYLIISYGKCSYYSHVYEINMGVYLELLHGTFSVKTFLSRTACIHIHVLTTLQV